MLGELSKSQIEEVLHRELVGRIGCYSGNEIYIVPVTYAYDGRYIYAHSQEGKKIEMMRKNPKVCFEVDSLENMANWRSVIVWGKYEELKGVKEKERGLKILSDRFAPMITSETAHGPQEMRAPHIVTKEKKAIVYRILVEERSGRFEKSNK
jgi:nitroimidazol reductase NimA-like FMN-containing flavoprotein (pyridoxamine 5'-phosphate oxidase superfamily)